MYTKRIIFAKKKYIYSECVTCHFEARSRLRVVRKARLAFQPNHDASKRVRRCQLVKSQSFFETHSGITMFNYINNSEWSRDMK